MICLTVDNESTIVWAGSWGWLSGVIRSPAGEKNSDHKQKHLKVEGMSESLSVLSRCANDWDVHENLTDSKVLIAIQQK
jgi:hypothetical protein